MTVETLFTQINMALRGTDDDVPVEGSPDYELWLGTANRKKDEWAQDGKQARTSLWSILSVGTVVAATQSYNLASTFILPADELVVTTTDNIDKEFRLVKPAERKRFINSAYIYGLNPQKLVFVDTIAADSDLVGGTIKLSGYTMPADLEELTDIVPIDDPYWLVYAVASEIAFNDITYEDKYVDLNVKANNLYKMMSSNNRRGTSGNPRTALYNVDRITGTETRRNNRNAV